MEKKNILIGVSSSISIYKICDIIRILKKNNYNARVILTKHAEQLISKQLFENLCQDYVFSYDMFSHSYNYYEHISLARWADLFLIAPATANIIGKLSNGIADDLLTTTALAATCPILICPAMNNIMYKNKIVQKNINILKENNFDIIEPEEGELGCGENGKGRLADLNKIFRKCELLLNYPEKKNILKNKKILILNGPTREYIDNIRFISNKSSGKMGLSMALAAYDLGAEVKIISGITKIDYPDYLNVSFIETGMQLLKQAKKIIQEFDIIISPAAVSDFMPTKKSKTKIPRKNNLSIEFVPGNDILSHLTEYRKENQAFIGFCAVDKNLDKQAKSKLISKKLDYIISNDISKADIAMDSDFNKVSIFSKNQKKIILKRDTKYNISLKIYFNIFS